MGIHPAGILVSVKAVTEILPKIVERERESPTAIPPANSIQINAADKEYSIWQDSRGHTDWTVIENDFSFVQDGGIIETFVAESANQMRWSEAV